MIQKLYRYEFLLQNKCNLVFLILLLLNLIFKFLPKDTNKTLGIFIIIFTLLYFFTRKKFKN